MNKTKAERTLIWPCTFCQHALISLSLNLLGSYILVWEYLKKTKNKKNHITKAWNGTEPEKKITNRSTLGSTEGTEIPPELGSPKDGQRKSTRWRQGESKGQPTPSPLQFYGKIEVVLETPSERKIVTMVRCMGRSWDREVGAFLRGV